MTTLDRDRPDRPRNATDDETQYQVKGSPDIEPNRFNVSYGADQILEATARRILGPVDFVVQVQSGPGGGSRTLTLRAEPWKGGERFGDLRGKYYQRVRAQIPADFVQPGTAQTPRPLVAGDVVNVRVIAGSQQQRWSYRVVSTRPGRRRRGCSWWRPRTTRACRPTRPRTPPLRGTSTSTSRRSRRPATRSRRSTSTLRRRARTARRGRSSINDLGVLSHFDAVVWYTGDDLVPQAEGEGVTDENYRRGGPGTDGAFSLTGSTHLTNSGVRNAHMLRNYMNDGGKVLLTGRNFWVQQTTTRTAAPAAGLNSYSGYSWWQDPVYGFDYPPNQAGDDDRPHTAFFRELDMPNDWGQWWLGFGHRCEGVGTTNLVSSAVMPERGRPARRHADLLARHVDGLRRHAGADAGRADGRGRPADEGPDASAGDVLAHDAAAVPPGAHRGGLRGCANANGGAIISTRDSVSLGFGLEQIASTGDPQRGRRPRDGAPAADRRRRDRSDGHVAAAR